MRLRGAILGAGNIALRGHLPQWVSDERLRHAVEIVAVADLAESNRDAARALLPAVRLYPDAADLLRSERLDFCDICTPPFTHRGLIEGAARQGLHVVCEKPLAPTAVDADGIARAVRAAGVVFEPCHQYHHSPQWRAARDRLASLGRIHYAEYHVLRTAANEGNPHWCPSWRTEPEHAGGGILVDHGAHVLYLLRSVLGEPRAVRATTATLVHHDYRVEDTALVTLVYPAGLAQVNLTWAARRRATHYRFVGERGEIEGDDQRLWVHADRREEIQFGDGLSQDSSHSEWYSRLLREFLARVRRGDSSTQSLDEAVHVTRLIDRAYESARLGGALTPVEERASAH